MMHDVKTPNYSVINRQDNIELRKYPAMIIAEVIVSGPRKKALSDGFKILFDYISGNNIVLGGDSKKIKMTAPVVQQPKKMIATKTPVIQKELNEKLWQISFVMPKNFNMRTLPKPKNSKINIIKQSSQIMIVIKFSGIATQSSLDKHQMQLEKYILSHNLKIKSPVIYAYYNPPWTLPFMRRNEIMFIVTNDH